MVEIRSCFTFSCFQGSPPHHFALEIGPLCLFCIYWHSTGSVWNFGPESKPQVIPQHCWHPVSNRKHNQHGANSCVAAQYQSNGLHIEHFWMPSWQTNLCIAQFALKSDQVILRQHGGQLAQLTHWDVVNLSQLNWEWQLCETMNADCGRWTLTTQQKTSDIGIEKAIIFVVMILCTFQELVLCNIRSGPARVCAAQLHARNLCYSRGEN